MTDYELLREVRRMLFDAQLKAAAEDRWDNAYHHLDEAVESARSLIETYTKGRTR